jgi:hypothetical protein
MSLRTIYPNWLTSLAGGGGAPPSISPVVATPMPSQYMSPMMMPGMFPQDLSVDTSGLLPEDWYVMPWSPAMFASAYESSMLEDPIMTDKCGPGTPHGDCFEEEPFSPAYLGRADFEVEPMTAYATWTDQLKHINPVYLLIGGGVALFVIHSLMCRGRRHRCKFF